MEPTAPAQCTEAEVAGLLERGEPSEQAASSGRSVRRIAAGAALLVAAGLACAVAVSARADNRSLSMGKSAIMSKAETFGSAGDEQMLSSELNSATTGSSNYGQAVSTAASTASTAASAVATPASAPSSAIAPQENMHDGNPCGEDEEPLGFACYKKCSILTNGQAPVRSSPFSCCSQSPCPLSEAFKHLSVMPCDGYDVAGDEEGKDKCPHKEGVCYEDEELHLGMCYKSCSLLTNGAYQHRKTALTCCKSSGILPCLNPANTDTSMDYATGGGSGDGDSTTESKPHPPKQSLTELVGATS